LRLTAANLLAILQIRALRRSAFQANMIGNLDRMKSPNYALLKKTQIHQESAPKKSIAVATEAGCNCVGAARIVTERFD
jgi:hypothetical protein